jgi:cell division septum initiation protein DivIVA
MSDKITVAESIRRVAVLFQNMVEAADMLESIGSLEQAKAEADAARAAAESARNNAIVEAEKVAQEVNAANLESASVMASARKDAESVLTDAKAKADALIAAAHRDADTLIVAASSDASKAADAMTTQIAQMRSTLELIDAATADSLSKKAEAEQAAADAQAKLESIQDAIRKLAAV